MLAREKLPTGLYRAFGASLDFRNTTPVTMWVKSTAYPALKAFRIRGYSRFSRSLISGPRIRTVRAEDRKRRRLLKSVETKTPTSFGQTRTVLTIIQTPGP